MGGGGEMDLVLVERGGRGGGGGYAILIYT